MASDGTSRLTPGIAIAATLGCLVMAALVMGSLWQAGIHHNDLTDAQTHDNVAVALQSAENEGKASSQILQSYVATGDQTLIAQAQAHTQSGVQQLTSAIALSGGADPNGFVAKGQQLVQVSGQVIALRQTGDIQGATSLLTDLSPQFNAFITAQDQVIANEHQAAADNRSSADSAKTLTFWLAVLAGVVGFAMVAGGVYVVTRAPRRITGTASA
ncbi:MAG: hypothetical protein ABI559_07980 [Chloroflexota bacterium]